MFFVFLSSTLKCGKRGRKKGSQIKLHPEAENWSTVSSLLFTAEIVLSTPSSGINSFQTLIDNGSLKYYRPCDTNNMHNFWSENIALLSSKAGLELCSFSLYHSRCSKSTRSLYLNTKWKIKDFFCFLPCLLFTIFYSAYPQGLVPYSTVIILNNYML